MIEKQYTKKPMKFDPPIKSRFLPGEINLGLENLDFKRYKQHRLLCANAKPVVDNKPPKFSIKIYYNKIKLFRDEYVTKFNFKQNMDLVKAINVVSRQGGKVDCWNIPYKVPKIRIFHSHRNELKWKNNIIISENQEKYKRLTTLRKYGEYSPQTMAKCWKTLKDEIKSKSRYPWFQEISKYPSISHNILLQNTNVFRTKCYFDLELAESKLPLGRIVFELYNDYVSVICANFESFCKGSNGLSYRGTPFHRIIFDYWCQGGDVIKHNGAGSISFSEVPSSDIQNENFSLQHSCPGVLSTYNNEKNLYDSKFNLSFRPLKSMDGKKIVFGKVIKGIQNLFKINAYGTKYGKPLQKIIVSNCGVLDTKKNSSIKEYITETTKL